MHLMRSPETLKLSCTKTSFSSKMSVPIKVKLFEEAFGAYWKK